MDGDVGRKVPATCVLARDTSTRGERMIPIEPTWMVSGSHNFTAVLRTCVAVVYANSDHCG